MKTKKRWYDYLWVAELLYLTLGLFNILFAWLGMLFFHNPSAYCRVWRPERPIATVIAGVGSFWGFWERS